MSLFRLVRTAFLTGLAVLAGGCAGERDDGITDIAFMEAGDDLMADGVRLSYAQAHVRAATEQGLVTLDAEGQVVPAIAERWIVTDDGESYIFRLRDIELAGEAGRDGDNGPDARRLTAAEVRDALLSAIRRLDGTSMGRDLAKIRDIRAMTGRVVEVRLRSAMPGLLQLLAQPELALAIPGVQLGPMTARAEDGHVVLDAVRPMLRGLPEQADWDEMVRPLRVYGATAEEAVRGFYDGRYDVVMGGTIATLPLADTGPLSRGTVRVDSTVGLFGLDIRSAEGFLAEAATRQALSRAIDRDVLMEPFNLGGWTATTRLVPPTSYDGFYDGATAGAAGERWPNEDMTARRAPLQSAAQAWRAANGEPARLRLFLPEGPGATILLDGLREQLNIAGVQIEAIDTPAQADLVLRDRAARYASPRWFLNQFACELARRLCSSNTDFLVELAADTEGPDQQESYLLEAEYALLAEERFVPIGQPIRWALVRSGVEGFAENPWGWHPLFPFARAPI